MKTVLFFAFVMLMISCEERGGEANSPPIETAVILKIQNSKGENFLNTVDADKTQLYYETNGTLNIISYNWDTPKGYIVFQEPPIDIKMIKIFCYTEGNTSSEKTFVKWSNGDMDTLSYTVTRLNRGIVVNDLKYNAVKISIGANGIYDVQK